MTGMLNLATLVADEREQLRKGWGWIVALGVLITVLGFAALVFVGFTTLFTVLFVGWSFAIAGTFEVIHAVVRRGWSGFWIDLLSGVVTAAAGIFIIAHPGAGASVLTIVVGATFLVGGIFRLAAGLGARSPYAGWLVLHGVVSALLGVMILSDWPESALWVIGTLVAIDLILEGCRLISFGLAVRGLVPETYDRPAPTGAEAPPPMG